MKQKLFFTLIFLSVAFSCFAQNPSSTQPISYTYEEVIAREVVHDSTMSLCYRLRALECQYSVYLSRPENDYLIKELVAIPCGGELNLGFDFYYVYRNPNFQNRYLLVEQKSWNNLGNHIIGIPSQTFTLLYNEHEIWITSMSRCW